MTNEIEPGRVVALSPLVRRITQNNPGLMTGAGTNTYIVGRHSVFVLDPGEDRDDHLRNIADAIGGAAVAGVAPTHAHPDHWPLAPRLARMLGTRTFGFASHGGYVPDVTISDGARIAGDDWSLTAIHTPGHVSDHVAYLLEPERALFTGDHVMGWSTSVISRPDGSLTSYLSSLRRVRDLDLAVLYPAHGGIVVDARARIEALIAHREMRSEQILAALGAGCATVPALVALIYAEVDRRLHPVAQQSVLAHLDAFVESGRVVVQSGDRFALSTRGEGCD